MKKLLLLAGAASLLAANQAFAQDSAALTDVPCQTNYYTTKSDNWFIQLGAGISMPFVENTHKISDAHITATYNVAFGKWFSPYFAWRAGFLGGSEHFSANEGKMAHFKNVNANIDLMWDFLNSVSGVNTKRVVSIVPFIGLGSTYAWDYKNLGNLPVPLDAANKPKKNEWLFPVSAGLQLNFRLCEYVSIFAEGRLSFYGDSWNNVVRDRPVDINGTAIAGLTFNLGGRSFKEFNPCDYSSYINNLNNQVNDLRGELATTAAALAAATAQLPCPEVVEAEQVIVDVAPLLATVRFSIDSSTITPLEKVNVYNVAEWLKANEDQNVVITGFADRDTGTSAYNMALSERRAKAVYNMLVNEYGINPNRLATAAKGSDEQIYNVNNWNRIVVFSVGE